MAVFTGAGVALVTPFKKDKSIDYDKLDELIEFHCNNQTDSIVICGTSGEASTLAEKEHMDCVKFTVERTRGRIPVIAGTGSNSTRTAMELTALAASYGVDGVLVVTPNGLHSNYFDSLEMVSRTYRLCVRDCSNSQWTVRPVFGTCKQGSSGKERTFRYIACCWNHDRNIMGIKQYFLLCSGRAVENADPAGTPIEKWKCDSHRQKAVYLCRNDAYKEFLFPFSNDVVWINRLLPGIPCITNLSDQYGNPCVCRSQCRYVWFCGQCIDKVDTSNTCR